MCAVSARSTRRKIPPPQLVVSPNREKCLLFGFYLIFDAIGSGLFLLSGKMKTPEANNRVHSPLTSDHAVCMAKQISSTIDDITSSNIR